MVSGLHGLRLTASGSGCRSSAESERQHPASCCGRWPRPERQQRVANCPPRARLHRPFLARLPTLAGRAVRPLYWLYEFERRDVGESNVTVPDAPTLALSEVFSAMSTSLIDANLATSVRRALTSSFSS